MSRRRVRHRAYLLKTKELERKIRQVDYKIQATEVMFHDAEIMLEDAFSQKKHYEDEAFALNQERIQFRRDNDNLLRRVAEERKRIIEKLQSIIQEAYLVAEDNLHLKLQLKQITRQQYWDAKQHVDFIAIPSDEEVKRAAAFIKEHHGVKDWQSNQFERILLGQNMEPYLQGEVEKLYLPRSEEE